MVVIGRGRGIGRYDYSSAIWIYLSHCDASVEPYSRQWRPAISARQNAEVAILLNNPNMDSAAGQKFPEEGKRPTIDRQRLRQSGQR